MRPVAIRMVSHATAKRFPRNLACFLNQFPIAPEHASADPAMVIKARIAEIDAMLSRQLNPIVHHCEFQRLEATWRGLRCLVYESETGHTLQIRILNVGLRQLRQVRSQSPRFDSSAVSRLIWQSGVESSRSAPLGLLVGDFEFGRREDDIALLEWISHIAAAAHAPFLAAAGPAMFGLGDISRRSPTCIIWPADSTTPRTPHGIGSASRRIRSTSAFVCLASSCGVLTATTGNWWRPFLSSRR